VWRQGLTLGIWTLTEGPLSIDRVDNPLWLDILLRSVQFLWSGGGHRDSWNGLINCNVGYLLIILPLHDEFPVEPLVGAAGLLTELFIVQIFVPLLICVFTCPPALCPAHVFFHMILFCVMSGTILVSLPSFSFSFSFSFTYQSACTSAYSLGSMWPYSLVLRLLLSLPHDECLAESPVDAAGLLIVYPLCHLFIAIHVQLVSYPRG
jgi:hypothetical protein